MADFAEMSPSGTCRHFVLARHCRRRFKFSSAALHTYVHLDVKYFVRLQPAEPTHHADEDRNCSLSLQLSRSLLCLDPFFFLNQERFSILIWTLFLKLQFEGKIDDCPPMRDMFDTQWQTHHYSAPHIFLDAACLYRSSEAHALGTEQTIHRLESKITKAAD